MNVHIDASFMIIITVYGVLISSTGTLSRLLEYSSI